MSRARQALCVLYGVIAAVALVATWRQNLAFMAEGGTGFAQGFAAFWPALLVNRPTISITVDIFLVALAASIWMVLEGRRLHVRFVWLYLLGGIFIAISVTFPLFLIARERKLAMHDSPASEPKPTLVDRIGLGVLTLGVFAFAAYCINLNP